MFLCFLSACYSDIQREINEKSMVKAAAQGGLKPGFYEINSGRYNNLLSEKDSVVELKDDYIPPGLEEVLAEKFTKSDGWNTEGEGIWTQKIGATVSYTFTGTKAYVVGIIDNKHGSLAVYIDDVKVGTFSAAGPERLLRKLLYSSPDLSNGVHTIKLELISVACALHAFYILNNQGVGMYEIAKPSYDVVRGDTFLLAISRVGSDYTESSVNLKTVAGTAKAGSDYVEYSSTINFKANEIIKYIKIKTIANSKTENLTFTAQISSPTSGALIGFTNTTQILIHSGQVPARGLVEIPPKSLIYDGDWTINQGSAQTKELGAAVNAKFAGTRVYVFGNKGADFGKMEVYVDHVKAATIDCNGQEEQDVLLFTSEPLAMEIDHSVRASLVSGKIAITKIVYLSNLGTGLVEFKTKEATVENGQALDVEINRIGGNIGKFTVSVETVDGTAKSGADYKPYSGTLQFEEGETSKKISILTIKVDRAESTDFSIKLSNPTDDAVVGYNSPLSITINHQTIPTRSPEPVPPAPTKDPDDQKGGNTVIVVSVVSVIVILIVVIVVVVILMRRRKPQDSVISQPMLNSNQNYTGA